MGEYAKDSEVIILKKSRKGDMKKKWVSNPGVVLSRNKNFVTVKHKNYIESYLISDFICGDLKIKG